MDLEETISDTTALTGVAQLIQSNLPLTPVPTVPEIQLHRAGPESGLWRFAEADETFGAPYWAHYWGGGLALARYVLDHPNIVDRRRALDLGAGSGIVGIAAAKSGARQVLALDFDPYAITAIGLNAAANEVAISTVLADLTAIALPEADVVLVGDLFYDARLARRVLAFLDRCLGAGMEAIIGDPGRAFLPRARLEKLAEYPGLDFGINLEDGHTNTVFAYRSA